MNAGTVLRTPRLILRPPEMADAEAIYQGLSEWDVTRMLARPHWPYRREHAVAWLEGLATNPDYADDHAFIMALTESPERAIGAAALHRRPPDGRVIIGYWLAKPYWGRGLMTEAAEELLRHGFEALGLERIVSGCLADNPASLRVHMKLGFRTLGRSIVHCAPRGEDVEHVDLALDRADWDARPGGARA